MKVFTYANCSTCKNALKFLDSNGIEHTNIAIVDHPPTVSELKRMLGYIKSSGGTFKNLFNTSGVQYRELKVAEMIKSGLTENAAIGMLSENGKLIKRPFVLTENDGWVGFKKDEWSQKLRRK